MCFFGVFNNNSKNIKPFSILMLAFDRGGGIIKKKLYTSYTPTTYLWGKIDDEKEKMLK